MQLNLTPFVRNLLIINIVVFFGEQLLNATAIIHRYFALYPFESKLFFPFQVVTHLFLHGDMWHLIGNMFMLLVFGPMLEQFWGSKRFAFFYFFCGLGAALLHSGIETYELVQIRHDAQVYLQKPEPDGFANFISKHQKSFYQSDDFYTLSNEFEQNPASTEIIKITRKVVSQTYTSRVDIPTVGASGAIFGLLTAFGLLFPNTVLLLGFFFPIKAKYFVLLFGAVEVYRIIQQNPGDNVAHFAHLGGMLFAFILIRIWRKKRDTFY